MKLDKYMRETWEGTITRVDEGIVKDFVKNLEKWKNPDVQCVQVTVNYGDGETHQLLTVPKSAGYSKSNLKRFVEKNKLPLSETKQWLGKKILLTQDSQGFVRVAL